MKRIRFVLLLVLTWGCGMQLNAQDFYLDHFRNWEARSIGPAGMSGRVTCIDVNPQDKKQIYVGTASGGVWYSSDAGTTWSPIFDDQETLSIGAIAIHPRNPDLIWVGTGEGNPRNSHNSGAGVYKSLDGGVTWHSVGLEETKLIHRIVLDPYDLDVAYIAALGSAWGASADRGVYKTDNGGDSWTKSLYIDENTGAADMIMDPTNPQKIIVSTWDYRRRPWTFRSGGPGSGIHITYDGGDSWKKLGQEDGLPGGELGRIGLAAAQSDPERMYAFIESKDSDIYRSDDGGHSWKAMDSKGDFGNRPFYYADIYVDPSNENRVYSIHSIITRSEDGGESFETFVPWQEVHPDHHAFWIDPENPDYIIDGNDGGLAISYDRGESWRFVENLPVGQFYHINYDMEIPYNVYGGMQDNGSWIGPSSIWKRGGIRNADWRELYFGDGFDVVPRLDNNRYGYAMSQGGNVSYYDKETGNNQFIKPVHPDGKVLRFNWNAAIARHGEEPCGVYFGSQYVHYSQDCGSSWKIISPDLTSNDSTKQKQAESGGLTIDATQAENHTTILSIAPSPVESDILWVGTDDGRLHKSADHGENWTRQDRKLPGCPQGAWFPHIEPSPHDAEEVFITVNNYRNDDWSAYAYHSDNGGLSFRRIVDDNDVDGHVLCLIQDPTEENLLFLGTDVGLYVSWNKGQDWHRYDHGVPHVNVRDLKIHPREHDLIIGTFGRAIYILDNLEPLRYLARDADLMDQEVRLFDANHAYLTSLRSVDGTRFVAGTYFLGENRMPYARFPVWLAPNEENADEEESSSKKEKKATDASAQREEKPSKAEKPKETRLYIIDAQGDTLRTLDPKLKEGLNTLTWRLNQDGVDYPSRRKKKKDAQPPSGIPVLPGAYKAVLVHPKGKDSAQVMVHLSPRSALTEEEYQASLEARKSLDDYIRRAAAGADFIREAKSSIEDLKSLESRYPEDLRDSLMQRTEEISQKLAQLEERYFTPSDFKGIDSVTPRLTTYIWRARAYLGTVKNDISGNARDAMNKARTEIEKTENAIEDFKNDHWSDYMSFIEGQEINFFRTVEE